MSKQRQIQLFCAAVFLLLALCVLAGVRAYTVLTTSPEDNPSALEQRIDRCVQRYPQWEVAMEAEYLASQQVGDRLYVAFTNAAELDLFSELRMNHGYYAQTHKNWINYHVEIDIFGFKLQREVTA